MTAEMIRLRKLLTALGIEWRDQSEDFYLPLDRTKFMINGFEWSVIHGYGSYGGYDFYSNIDRGLLELMTSCVNNGDPIGYLTADDVLDYVKIFGKWKASKDNES